MHNTGASHSSMGVVFCMILTDSDEPSNWKIILTIKTLKIQLTEFGSVISTSLKWCECQGAWVLFLPELGLYKWNRYSNT